MARALVVVAASLLFGGCSLGSGDADSPLVGPSELATSVTLAASPDQLPRDGSSQSIVTVTVRDASGQPKAGQRLNVTANIGSVSESNIVTGSDGRATFALTAPAAGTVGNVAVIQVVPVGDNADNAIARTLSVMLTGPSNATAPIAAFEFSPQNPQVRQTVTFDASGTTDENAACGNACTYSWNFDDGSTGSGRVVTHSFTVGRMHTITLTVTDAAGLTTEARQTVTVTPVSAPTVSIAVSPVTPAVDQQATFTATGSAATGHSIETWQWNFGDGTSQTTTAPTISHSFSALGTYGVSVTVTDDLGQTGRASMNVTVTSGIAFPTPAFTASPTSPTVGQTVNFNASGITGANGATIVEYTWDFGDGDTSGPTSSPTASHEFDTAQTFIVRLTVRDSAGRTDSRTISVSVVDP